MWLDFNSLDSIALGYSESVGRALALAQSFEQNCKFVLLVANLDAEIEKGQIGKPREIASYSERLESWFKLGRDINQFQQRHNVCPADIDVLQKGVDARNYIAHEAALPMLIGSNAWKAVNKEARKFAEQVTALAQAENLICHWSFAIQEKDLVPQTIAASFVHDVVSWVLAPIQKAASI